MHNTSSKIEKIKAELRNEFRLFFSAGGKLPGQRTLASRLGASLSTIDRALLELEQEGLVQRRHGSGTFVTEHSAILRSCSVAVVLMRNAGLPPSYWYHPALRALSEELSKKGHATFYYYVEDLDVTQALLPQLARQGNHAAVVLAGVTPDAWIDEVKASGMPVLLLDHVPLGNSALPYVTSDHEAGIAAAVAHLKKLGHRRIGFFATNLLGNFLLRFESFCIAMGELALPLRRECIIRHWQPEGGREQLARLFASPSEAPTAFVCGNDHVAAMLITELERLGLQVPRDVSIVGFDAEPPNEFIPPGLTSLRVDRLLLGQKTALLLLERLAGHTAQPAILSAPLVVGTTTRKI